MSCICFNEVDKADGLVPVQTGIPAYRTCRQPQLNRRYGNVSQIAAGMSCFHILLSFYYCYLLNFDMQR